MRSGYTDGCDGWELIRWRGAVASAIRGRRGQAFLRDLLTALDVLPDKRLIARELEQDGEVCALGSVGKMRGLNMNEIDPEEYDQIAEAFGISSALVREIESINDDDFSYAKTTPEERFQIVRKWVTQQLREEKAQ